MSLDAERYVHRWGGFVHDCRFGAINGGVSRPLACRDNRGRETEFGCEDGAADDATQINVGMRQVDVRKGVRVHSGSQKSSTFSWATGPKRLTRVDTRVTCRYLGVGVGRRISLRSGMPISYGAVASMR